MRLTSLLAAVAIAPFAAAAWTFTNIHPATAVSSELYGASGNKQAGFSVISNINHASLWSATAASFVDLHPAGASESIALDVSGTKQAGYAKVGGVFRASLWSGTAGSWLSLHPTDVSASYLIGLDASKQVGFVLKDGVERASLWSGTAASRVDLHPTDSTMSNARNVLGNTQVGYAEFAGQIRAGKWTGTAASWISLHPTGAQESVANTLSATKQGGYAMFNDNLHAALWSGTAASFVDMHPVGSAESHIYDMTDALQVGFTKLGDGAFRAAYWSGTAASFIDLHADLPSQYVESVCHGVAADATYEYITGVVLDSVSQKFRAALWKRPVGSSLTFEFTLNKTTVAGQNSVQGTITLGETQASPTVFTTYDNSSLVTTPATVTVPASTLLKNFQITVVAVTSPINTLIYAKYGSVTQSKPLTLAPLIPTSVSCTPNPVTGGQTTTGRIVINGVAGPGGRTIAVFDNSPNATTPSTVVVPAGASQVTFPIPTTAVTSVKNVTITARVSAGEKTGTFRINP